MLKLEVFLWLTANPVPSASMDEVLEAMFKFMFTKVYVNSKSVAVL